MFFPSSGHCEYTVFEGMKSRGAAVSSAQTKEECEAECSGNSLCRAYEFNDSPERPWRNIRCRLHETHELYVEPSPTVDGYVRMPCFEEGKGTKIILSTNKHNQFIYSADSLLQ